MCDMIFKVVEKNGRVRRLDVPQNLYNKNKSDFLPYLLKAFIEAVLFEKKCFGNNINATQEVDKFIRSVAGISTDLQIYERDNLVLFDKGSCSFHQVKERKVNGYIAAFKQLWNRKEVTHV